MLLRRFTYKLLPLAQKLQCRLVETLGHVGMQSVAMKENIRSGLAVDCANAWGSIRTGYQKQCNE